MICRPSSARPGASRSSVGPVCTCAVRSSWGVPGDMTACLLARPQKESAAPWVECGDRRYRQATGAGEHGGHLGVFARLSARLKGAQALCRGQATVLFLAPLPADGMCLACPPLPCVSQGSLHWQCLLHLMQAQRLLSGERGRAPDRLRQLLMCFCLLLSF